MTQCAKPEITDGKTGTRRQPDHGGPHVADRQHGARRPAGSTTLHQRRGRCHHQIRSAGQKGYGSPASSAVDAGEGSGRHAPPATSLGLGSRDPPPPSPATRSRLLAKRSLWRGCRRRHVRSQCSGILALQIGEHVMARPLSPRSRRSESAPPGETATRDRAADPTRCRVQSLPTASRQ